MCDDVPQNDIQCLAKILVDATNGTVRLVMVDNREVNLRDAIDNDDYGVEIESESDVVPTLCEALSESDEDRFAQQLRKHWGNLRTGAVIAETTLAPIDLPLDGDHKME